MKLRRQSRQDNFRMNLTPLIDTVFLLLVFFMLTTTFNREAQLKISLPEVESASEATEDPRTIRIIINEKGEYAINDIEHSLINTQLDTLKRALQKEAKEQTDPPILISADGNAPHQAVIKAMEAARDLNFLRLSFEAEQTIDEN